MKKQFLILLELAFSTVLLAENLSVTNVRLTNQNTATDEITIVFDLSWGDSWRNERNHDAVWIFVKHRTTGNPYWRHTKGFSVQTLTQVESQTVSDSAGVFLSRRENGEGMMSVENIQLTWNYGRHGISDDTEMEVFVGALEMVYVPEGAFSIGDGVSTATFRKVGATTPFRIEHEEAIQLGGSNPENLTVEYFQWDTDPDFFTSQQTLPAVFPKGFSAFYCMKYELSQGIVVDFLNRISENQMTLHTTGSYINEEQGNPVRNGQSRNTIRGNYPNFTTSTPYRASGFIRHWLFFALADWTGLRPMTEFEWEKANRGPENPVAGEFAWGNTQFVLPTGVSDDGSLAEVAQNAASNVNAAIGYLNFTVDGPIRSGWQRGSTRVERGATFWGIRDMTGNVWERAITINSPVGRAFDGAHGDGNLHESGFADVATWPDVYGNPHNIGHRGGSFSLVAHPVSARDFSTGSSGALSNYGGRLVRSAATVLTTTANAEKPSLLPSEITLFQNFPNPFNPSTKIRFSLQEAGKITISVYSMIGQKIATLVQDEFRPPGVQEIPFDAAGIASGVYIIRLEQGTRVQNLKISLLK